MNTESATPNRQATLPRAAGRSADTDDLSWRILTTLGAFRLFVAAALLVLFFISSEPRIFGDRYPLAFAGTTIGYLFFAAIVQVGIRFKSLSLVPLVVTPLLIDIVAVTALMHMSGGIGTGLGGLLIVFLGVASLILPLRTPPVFAAMSTFAVLGEQLFSQVSALPVDYPAAGLLCGIIFMMAFASQVLSKGMRASEALARQRGVDLQNLSELNEYIVQHLRESILVIDGENRIRLNNASAARLLGTSQRLAGQALAFASAALDEHIRKWRADFGMSSHPEIVLSTGDSAIRVTAHLAPLVKDGERAGPILIFLEDSSLLNERVQQSKLASLGRLSASIAHEIRNPVGAMSHAAQLLAESDGVVDADRRLTDIIQSNSERVSHIIDNVLQLSRRESGQPERLPLKPWLDDFAAEFSKTLELQEGELQVHDVDPDLVVRIDRSHLRQVMWNLCDNAVKYASETGGIHVEIRASRLEGRDRPYLEVLDRGFGVDDATAEKMFEPFFTARSGGTGLGLYISRELCELNRATLLHLDRAGGGSIFRIVFADPDRWGNDTS